MERGGKGGGGTGQALASPEGCICISQQPREVPALLLSSAQNRTVTSSAEQLRPHQDQANDSQPRLQSHPPGHHPLVQGILCQLLRTLAVLACTGSKRFIVKALQLSGGWPPRGGGALVIRLFGGHPCSDKLTQKLNFGGIGPWCAGALCGKNRPLCLPGKKQHGIHCSEGVEGMFLF